MVSALSLGGGGDRGQSSYAPKTSALSKAKKSSKTAASRLNKGDEEQSATLESYKKTGRTYSEQKKDQGANPLENVLSSILTQINRPSQGVLRGIQARNEGLGGIIRGVGRGLATGVGDDATNLRGAIIAPMTENYRTGTPEQRAAIEAEAEKIGEKGHLGYTGRVGELGAKITDLGGTIATDPTTFLGGGSLKAVGKGSSAARSGAKAVEKAAGKEALQEVSKAGAAALAKKSPERYRAIREALKQSDEAKAFKKGEEAYAKKILGTEGNRLTRQRGALTERPGVKLLGETVLPKAEVLDPIAKALRLPQAAQAIKTSAPARLATEALSTTGALRRELGDTVAEGVNRARVAAFASKGRQEEALRAQLAAIAPQIDNVESFIAETVDPALRQGPVAVETLESSLRTAGKAPEADLVAALRGTLPEGAEAINAAPTEALKRWARTTGANLNEIVKELPADPAEANAAIQQLTRGAVKTGVETSATQTAIKNFGKQVNEAAIRRIQDDVAANVLDEAGNPVLLKAAEGVEKPLGFVKYGDNYTHPEVARYLKSLQSKAEEPGAWGALGRASESATQASKNLILNLPPFFAARLTRDLFSNNIQMWLKGFNDPSAYKDSWSIMRGLSGKGGKVPEKLAPYVDEMNELGVIDSGRIRTDLTHAGIDFRKVGKASKAARKAGLAEKNQRVVIDPRVAESLWTRWGTKGNTFSDDFGRTAMYVWARKAGNSPAEAARLVDEALFDYSNLTHVEQKLRQFVPFYTFMRKNTQLQAWALAHVPQKTLNIERIREALANEGAVDGEALPQYALASGQIPLANIGGTPLLGAIETPQQAGAKTVQPLVDIASSLPGVPEKYRTQAGAQGGGAGVLSNIGGFGPGLAKAGVEETTGESLFTGAPLEQTDKAKLDRLLKALLPRAGQYETTTQKLSGTDAERAAAILGLLGVSSTAVTDKKQTGEYLRRAGAINQAATRQGIPTVTESRRRAARGGSTKRATRKTGD